MTIYFFSRYESKWKPLNGAKAKSLQDAKDYMNTLSGHYRLIPYCVCVVKKREEKPRSENDEVS